jgi:glycosyltransferase involved in cell wall biosynthesis
VSAGKVVIAAEADPLAPGTWSGIPLGLANGLRAHGVTVDGVASPLGRPVDLALRLALAARYRDRRSSGYGPEMDWVRSRGVARRLAPMAPDAVIQISTRFQIPSSYPTVTLEDATVLQTTRAQADRYQGVRASVIAGWAQRQGDIYRRARACCCATEWTKRSIVDEYGIDPGKVHVVGFGRNLEVDPAPRDWGSPRFVWIGREWERKNGLRVLRAFDEVRRMHPRATIDFVGDHPSLGGHAGARGYGVLSLRRQRDQSLMRSLLQQATAFVMPSLYEPFGMVYVEAGAAGVPSIGTTRGGAAEAIGTGGMVIEPTDERALCEAMLELADGPKAQALGERAVQHATGFTWRSVAERMLSALPRAG